MARLYLQTGREQAKRRPALVLSPLAYNRKVGLGIFCPVTSKVKGYPFEVLLPDDLPITGVVLADQVKSFDRKARRAELICKAPQTVITELISKLKTLLPLPSSEQAES